MAQTGYGQRASGFFVKTGVVLGGAALTLLALALTVELLRLYPLTDVSALAAARVPLAPITQLPVLDGLLAQGWFYISVMLHDWLLGVVPVLGLLLTWLALRQLGDDASQAYLERIHEMDEAMLALRGREELAIKRWERTEQGFEQLMQGGSDIWLVLDGQQRVRRCNAAAVEFLKHFADLPEDMGARADGVPLIDVWPEVVQTPLYRALIEGGAVKVFNGEIQLSDSTYLKAWVWPLGDETGVLLRDVSHLHRPEAFKDNAELLVKQLVAGSLHPVAVLDRDARYMYVSEQWRKALGIPGEAPVEGASHLQMLPDFPPRFGPIMQRFAQAGEAFSVGEGRDDARRMVHGEEATFSWHMHPWRDGGGKMGGVVLHAANITELVRLRAQVKDAGDREHALAYSDALTGLPNRQLFNDRLNMALAQAYRQLGKVALFFLDLDGFKAVNDKLGHDCGDMLLKQVAGRLKGCVRQTDTVARLGGDEFTMILNIRDKADADAVAQKILQVIREPYDLGGVEGRVGTSIGIALYPQDAAQAAELVKMADGAMYAAKQGGKNTWRYHGAAAVQMTATLGENGETVLTQTPPATQGQG